MATRQPQFTDQEINAEWTALITEFNSAFEKCPKDINVLSAIIAKAKLSRKLTNRQTEGIIERCNNLINGTYGVISIHKKAYLEQQTKKQQVKA